MMPTMTDKEIDRLLRAKYPSHSKRRIRKSKLKMVFKDKLDIEIARTIEKLELLIELKEEASNGTSLR